MQRATVLFGLLQLANIWHTMMVRVGLVWLEATVIQNRIRIAVSGSLLKIWGFGGTGHFQRHLLFSKI